MQARWVSAVVLLFSFCAAAQDLASPDPKVRTKAARNLAKSGAEAIPQLIPLLNDQVVEVRQEAVRSIVAIGTQTSLDPLIKATRDNDPEAQIRAVDGIVNFYMPGYVESGLQRLGSAVRSRFDKENRQVLDPYITVRPDAIQAIAAVVSKGASMDSRAAAARAAGILRGKAALPDLIEALRSKDDHVMYESLIAIQKLRDPSAGSRVVFLVRDLNERVQLAAIETVGILKAREAIPDLQRVFNESRSEKVRKSALGSLAMIGDPSTRSLFLTGFSDKSDGVRASAAEGLARLKNPADRPVLAKAFADERKMAPRLAEAFGLVAMGQTETGELSPLTYLVNTLNSKSYRDVAQPYLSELALDAGVRTALHGFLTRGTKDEKIGLSRVLAASGDRSSVAPLQQLTKDPDPDVAQEAIRAVRNLQARL